MALPRSNQTPQTPRQGACPKTPEQHKSATYCMNCRRQLPSPGGFIHSNQKPLDSRYRGVKRSKLLTCQLSGVPGSSRAAFRGAVSLEDTGNTVCSQGKSLVLSEDQDSVIFSPNVSKVFGTFSYLSVISVI